MSTGPQVLGYQDYDRGHVIVVLGGSDVTWQRERAQRVACIASRCAKPTLVVFTGYNGEAQRMYDLAKRFGLPDSQPVLLEQESSHTRENADHTRDLLVELGFDLSTLKLTVVTCMAHSIRAAWTFRAAFPAAVVRTRSARVRTKIQLRRQVDLFRGEPRRLVMYTDKGDLAPPPRALLLIGVLRRFMA